MGYEITERVCRIRLLGTEFDEVTARASYPTAGEYLARTRTDADLLTSFAEHLLDWNLTRGGEPVPCTLDEVHGLDTDLALTLAATWARNTTRVQRSSPPEQTPAPAVEPSSNGVQMETL